MFGTKDLFQLFSGHMRIDLRSGDVGVTENRLDGTQVGAIADHVRRTTVAQAVRRSCTVTFALVGKFAGTLHNLPDSLPGKRGATGIDKKYSRAFAAGEDTSRILYIRKDGLLRRLPQWRNSLFVALTTHDYVSRVEIEVRGPQVDNL